jgi:phosphoribosylanthranilate isomerase
VIVQLYTMQSPEEAIACIEAGADHVGITPPQGLPGELPSLEAMREIVDAVGDRARVIALTVSMDPDWVIEMVRVVRPAILHFCPLAGDVTPSQVAAIRVLLPGTQVMQAVSVTGPESIAEARAYAAVADYLILDTQAPDIPGVGASGAVHDWSISRRIVEAVAVPVILAGGLSPENVADAVRAVRPWGVDSLTHTNRALAGGGFRKDLDRVAAFAAAARLAWVPDATHG